MTELQVTRGDTFERTVNVAQADGTVYNLTGATLWWTLKAASDVADNDDDALVKLSWADGGASAGISVATPADGEAVVTLTPAQTNALSAGAVYRYDLQVKDSAGRVFTVDRGALVVLADVTRRLTVP